MKRKRKLQIMIGLLLCFYLVGCKDEQKEAAKVCEATPETTCTPSVTTGAEPSSEITDPREGIVTEFEPSLTLETMLTKEQAKEDLTYLYDLLKERHPAWLDGSTDKVAQVEKEYNQAVNQLKDKVSVLNIWQSACRMTAVLHDMHTHVDTDTEDEGLDNIDQILKYDKPVTVNGIAVTELEKRFKEMFSYEMEDYADAVFCYRALRSRNCLSLCGVDASNGVIMTFQTKKGEKSYSYPYRSLDSFAENQSQSEEESPWVSYHIDAKHDLGIFILTDCQYNEEYRNTVADFFKAVQKKKIDHIVIDLRNNGGGSSGVADEFITYLDVDSYTGLKRQTRVGDRLETSDSNWVNEKRDDPYKGEVYVLTDGNTFSAATDFAMIIQDNHMGEVVGETSPNLMDGYIDSLPFQMPNSKLQINISYKKCIRIDETKKGQPLTPDYEVKSKDALKKIYQLIK